MADRLALGQFCCVLEASRFISVNHCVGFTACVGGFYRSVVCSVGFVGGRAREVWYCGGRVHVFVMNTEFVLGLVAPTILESNTASPSPVRCSLT